MRLNTKQIIGGTLAVAAIATTTAGAISGDPIRASLDNGGGQSPLGARMSVLSGDGTKIAFLSKAQLTTEPTGGYEQLYVRDTKSNRTLLASASAPGAAANADVDSGTAANTYFDISANGRYVVFGTAATNLVAADNNGHHDVFRKDLETGAVELLSDSTDCTNTPCVSVAANGNSRDPSISATGASVAYATDASNILRDDRNGATDVAVVDVYVTARLHFPKPFSYTTRPNGPVTSPSINAAGDRLAFVAGATTTNLRAQDTNATSDVYIADLHAAYAHNDLQFAGPGSDPDLNGSGKLVAFLSDAALATADGNDLRDAYKYNAATGSHQLISTQDGQPAASPTAVSAVAIGADGVRTLVEAGGAIFSRRLDGAAVTELGDGAHAAIAGNGGVVAFTSADAIDAADTNAIDDVYTRDMGATDTTPPQPEQALYECGYKGSGGPVVSWSQDPSGHAVTSVSYANVGEQLKASAIDGAGNASETAMTVTGTYGGGCSDYDYDGYDYDTTPVTGIRILSVKLVNNAVRIRYRTTGGNGMALGDFRIQRVRQDRRGRTLGYSFATSARVGTISAGTRTITLPRPRARGTYRVRALIGTGKHRVLVAKRFRIGGPTAEVGS